MLTLAEAVEISLGGVAPQTAVDHKIRDGGVAQSHAATQGLVHRLLVVHLAVAHWLLALAIALAVLTAFLDKLLGGNELDAGIPHVAAMKDGVRGRFFDPLCLTKRSGRHAHKI